MNTNETILLQEAKNGNSEALVELLQMHESFIYNVSFKMVLSPFDAEDITQDIMIKIIKSLNNFKGDSSFKTWIYRITVNHCLTMKKKWLEERYQTFNDFELDLNSIPDQHLSVAEEVSMRELVEEARLSCMSGMLLCLTREQRMIFILGEIFNVPHTLASQILDISPENYRVRLTRARKDLYQFMDKKCGLINKQNPCRCPKKTKGFIKEGWVDPESLKFNTHFSKRIKDVVSDIDDHLKKVEDIDYQYLFMEHPYQERQIIEKMMDQIDKLVKELVYD